MPKIQVNDISLYYESHGTGEPIVFIAGFGADHTFWTEIVHRFKERYQVIVFDNRGIGQSDIPTGPYSIELMANDVYALCTKLNITQAHFVGNSMGGCILQNLAYLYPNLVKTAVIGNTTATLHSTFHFYLEAQLELLKANTSLATLIKASCSWLFSYQFLSKPGVLDGLIQLGLSNPYPFTLTGYEAQYAALKHFDSNSWVNKINTPILVIGADQDLIFREPLVKEFAGLIPKSKYYCFDESGHLPFLEHPDIFTQVVSDFIRTN